jgi:EAL domain-containing protein (putative c-di-GMP-specific phosphodiesterase class I)
VRSQKSVWRRYRAATTRSRRAGRIYTELRAAIDRCGDSDASDLTLCYQPIVDLRGGTTVGYEALLRWTPLGCGPFPIGEIIDTAEQTGLIVPLGDWVINKAIADAAALPYAPDGRPRYVSINVSPLQLHQPDFVERIAEALAATRMPATRVVVELIETQPLPHDDHDSWVPVRQLRELGVRVAIDDFGTGNAVLGHLRQPDIDILKLDRMFSRDVTSRRGRALVRAVVGLADDLGIELVIEGVEDDVTRQILIDLGCILGQGYLFGKPRPLTQSSSALTTAYMP